MSQASVAGQVCPRVILIGPPGSGKSSIGRLLGARLETSFHDTDAIIEERAKMSVSEIFLIEGEPFFRALESEVVTDEVKSFAGVLSLGGGSVMDATTRVELEKCSSPIVFLDVSLSSAAPRVGFNRDRPLLVGNPRSKWQELMNIRRPIYENLAIFTISTDEGSPAQIAQEISRRLNELEEVSS